MSSLPSSNYARSLIELFAINGTKGKLQKHVLKVFKWLLIFFQMLEKVFFFSNLGRNPGLQSLRPEHFTQSRSTARYDFALSHRYCWGVHQ